MFLRMPKSLLLVATWPLQHCFRVQPETKMTEVLAPEIADVIFQWNTHIFSVEQHGWTNVSTFQRHGE